MAVGDVEVGFVGVGLAWWAVMWVAWGVGTTCGGGSGAMPSTGWTLHVLGQQYPGVPWVIPIIVVLLVVVIVFGVWLLVLPFQFRRRLRGCFVEVG